jgi:hypothetical protein
MQYVSSAEKCIQNFSWDIWKNRMFKEQRCKGENYIKTNFKVISFSFELD